MKFLIPVLIDVEDVETLGKELTAEDLTSVHTGVRNALKAAEQDGFNHPESLHISIQVDDVQNPIEIGEAGPFVMEHEFDYEPTYVHDRSQDGDDRAVVLGKEIPLKIRHQISDLIIPILNKTPEA